MAAISKKHFASGLIMVLLTGCMHSEDGDFIVYETLDEIEVQLILEFGESGNYLPGELSQMVLTSGGSILVSDWGSVSIEQFSEKGEYIGTIARSGEGPGELPDLFTLTDAGHDTVMVRHRGMSSQVDLYHPGTGDMYSFSGSRDSETYQDQFVNIIGLRSDSTFYAKVSSFSGNLQDRSTGSSTFTRIPIAIVNRQEKILQDSLHMLKTSNPLTDTSGESGIMPLGMPPYQSNDQFRLMEDGSYVIARPDSSALYIYDRSHKMVQKIELNVKDRPVRNQDLDFYFSRMNVTESVRRQMEERVPNVKPLFLNMWVSESYFWLQTDLNESGKQIVGFTKNGEPVGTFTLSEFDDIRYIKNDRIYTLHKDPNNGHSIRIYQFD